MTDREFLESRIGGKLRGLRRSLKRRLTGEGVSWVAISLVVLVFATLGIDSLLHLPRHLRGLIMGLFSAGVLWVVWRQLLVPLRVPMNGEQLALLVEDRYCQIGDRLISALQLTRADGTETPGQSRAMIHKVVDQAGQVVDGLDFRAVVERPALRKRMALAVIAVELLVGFSVWQGGLMGMWWDRNVVFADVADVAWPQDIYLEVTGKPDMDADGNFRVLRGNDLEIIVTARPGDPISPAPAPDKITLYAWYKSVGWTEDPDIKLNRNRPRTYTKVFRGVSAPFKFYFVGGDDHREIEHTVTLIDPPGISWLRFTVEYPAYMKRPSRDFDESRAVLAAPPGSWISVRAAADKPIDFKDRDTGIYVDGQRLCGLTTDIDPPIGSPRNVPAHLVGKFQLTASPESPDAKGPSPMRTLAISLRDTDGFTNPRAAQYKIRVEPDIAPHVSLRKRGVSSTVTPSAILPFVIRAKDDSGLSELRVKLTWGDEKPKNKSWVVQPAPEGKSEFSTLYELDIKDLELVPGMTLRAVAQGDDLMPAELGGPNTGESGTLSFRIVKRDELLAEMVRKQKALWANFEQTVRKQEDSIATTEAVITIIDGGAKVSDGARRLRDATSMEIGVGGDCAKTSIAMQAILTEMVYNRIIEAKGRSETINRIITPLAEVAVRIETLTAEMKLAETSTDAKAFRKQTVGIQEVQNEILEVMREVLKEGIKHADAQELAYKLERLIERWDGVMRAAEAQADWDIRNALGFKCPECTKPLASEGGPAATVKCPHCKKSVAKPPLDRSDSD